MLPRIIGVGVTPLSQGAAGAAAPTPTALILQALRLALADAGGGATSASRGLQLYDLDGLIALPSLMGSEQFMMAHAVAGAAGLFAARQGRRTIVRTLDVGGAGPVAALLMAAGMVAHEGCGSVAVVAGDTPGSATLEEFLARADAACRLPSPEPLTRAAATPARASRDGRSGGLAGGGGGGDSADTSSGGDGSESTAAVDQWTVPSPVIPNLYDVIARWQMRRHGVTREQLVMVASLMTLQASRHPLALQRRPRTVEQVLSSRQVAPVTTALECAKRVDGAAAFIMASPAFARQHGLPEARAVEVLGGGEASGPPVPPADITDTTYASAAQAAAAAFADAGVAPGHVHYWSLYDCFPVCFIRALEAVGLAPEGGGGRYVERAYQAAASDDGGAAARAGGDGQHRLQALPPQDFPINTHGGLLGLGAPWEVPAMHGIAEAVSQLRGDAGDRQVPGARRALVYGNGGILSASAVAILGRCNAPSKL